MKRAFVSLFGFKSFFDKFAKKAQKRKIERKHGKNRKMREKVRNMPKIHRKMIKILTWCAIYVVDDAYNRENV